MVTRLYNSPAIWKKIKIATSYQTDKNELQLYTNGLMDYIPHGSQIWHDLELRWYSGVIPIGR